MSELIGYQLDDGVATLTLSNGKLNVISVDVLDALDAAFDQALADEAVIVVASAQAGVFSFGYDLKVLRADPEGAADLLTRGSTFARRMLAHPYPVIVACNGHARGEGAYILLSADHRIGAEGPFTISLPGVAVGMLMNRVGIELARDRLSNAAFQRAVNNAEAFGPQAAMAAGFLDQVVPADTLMDAARAVARNLAQLDMVSHGHTKLLARKALLEQLEEGTKADRAQILLETEIR